MWRGVALVMAVAFATPALAADPADHAGAYWMGGLSEGDDSCDVTLGSEPAIGGWSLKLAKDCKALGLPADIAAWYAGPDGSVRFIDPLRKTLLTFEPIEAGGYVADVPGREPISLDRSVEGPEPTEQDRMSGQWAVTKMGGDIQCRYASTSNVAGTKGTLKAAVGCPAPWSRVNRWEIAKGRIMLVDTAGKLVVALPGDSIEGFDGDDSKGDFVGFIRDWTD